MPSKKSKATFADLTRFLEEIGFTRSVVPGPYFVFRYPDSELLFAFRLYGEDELVDAIQLLGVRYQLDGWGIMDADEFDEWARQPSLAS